MPRNLRLQSAGATHQVMSRGDRRIEIFLDDVARQDSIAARLRRETTLSVKAIAARVHLGSSQAGNAELDNYLRRSAGVGAGQARLEI